MNVQRRQGQLRSARAKNSGNQTSVIVIMEELPKREGEGKKEGEGNPAGQKHTTELSGSSSKTTGLGNVKTVKRGTRRIGIGEQFELYVSVPG